MSEKTKKKRSVKEAINWVSVHDELPDAGMEVLVCYEHSDCWDRGVSVAEYDDSYDDESPWRVGGHLFGYGIVMYWADIPCGPSRS